ncbi:MAG: DUF2779 domain-containing protein [Nanoarchaeota archaeon]|mgnify:CR=1 FL=1
MLPGKLLKTKAVYQKLLTKSKYMNGLQCPRLLWIAVNDKQRLPAIEESAQVRFDEGHIVGDYAKKMFSEGIDIQTDDFKGNLEETQELLNEGKPLFEAAFSIDRLYSRADVLEPNKDKKDEWNLIEVKSSTKVKDEHIQDVAFQKYVYEKAGLKITKCILMHLNSEYVRHGEIKVGELFVQEDITEQVKEEIVRVPARIKEMLEIIDGEEPKSKIGDYCSRPYECPIHSECWKDIPENSVFDLYYGNKKALELFEKGIVLMKDIPNEYKLGDKQIIQKLCAITKKPHIDKKELKKFIKKLKFPTYFLDFETYQTAIPIYDNLSPYQQIPFQFSLDKIEKDGTKEHYSFIARGSSDPREKFLDELLKVLGRKGSIIVYNQSFEQGRMEELGEVFRSKRKDIAIRINRMVDLLQPFKDFSYYDCKQQGSCSIKYVLPALTGKSYSGMDIANGGQASLKYLWIIHGDKDGKRATPEEVAKVREDLEKYCGMDTGAMIVVLEKLKESIRGNEEL